MKCENGPDTGSVRKPKERGRLVEGMFNKQGSLPTRLVLGAARQVDICKCPPES